LLKLIIPFTGGPTPLPVIQTRFYDNERLDRTLPNLIELRTAAGLAALIEQATSETVEISTGHRGQLDILVDEKVVAKREGGFFTKFILKKGWPDEKQVVESVLAAIKQSQWPIVELTDLTPVNLQDRTSGTARLLTW